MALIALLLTRQREVECTAWLALVCKGTYPASIRWSEDEDRSTTFMTRYLEEVRRSPRHRCGKINARAMAGGTQQNRKAGLQKENPRTMRRNTDLCLGQELAYRTQQRIVRRAALDFYRLEDRSRVSGACGRLLRSERCGSRRCLYRHIPGVLHRKGKLDQEGEQTEQSPSAIRCLAPGPVRAWVSCAVLVRPGYQQRFLHHSSP
jgi:hypothetical protein